MPEPILRVSTDNMIGRVEDESARSEPPLGKAEFTLHRVEWLDLVVVLAIEVPPSCPVGAEVQDAVWRPFGLVDGFFQSSCHLFGFSQRTVGLDIGNPELCSVPGHVGMVPGEPG